MKRLSIVAMIGVMGTLLVEGVPCYVATNGSHSSPYDTWAKAATNIQSAVSYVGGSSPGETVWISNGIYYLNAPISVTNVKVRGFSGHPEDVIVDGGEATRCFYLNHANNELSGLTISNGYIVDTGAGIRCEKYAVISNCIIAGNVASNNGGSGIYIATDSGGSLLTDSTVCGNRCIGSGGSPYGGGVYTSSTNAQIRNTTIVSNYAAFGGGVYMNPSGGSMQNCLISRNTAASIGGGVYISYTGTVYNCEISDNVCNTGSGSSGGAIYIIGNNNAMNIVVRNCLVKNNMSGYWKGGSGIWCDGGGWIQNCTIVSNKASQGGGSCYGGGMYSTTTNARVLNCIIYSNQATANSDWYSSVAGMVFSNSCSSTTNGMVGTGNKTNNPQFVSAVGENYRLTENSLCINAGLNEAWMNGAVDLNGYQRIDQFSAQVDMGAFEYLPQGSLFMVR